MKRGPVKKTKKKVKESKIKTFLDNKKLLAVVISAFLIFTFLFGFVSFRNQSITGQVSLIDGIKEVGDSIIELLEPFFGFLLGDVGEGLLFAKILFFIIMFVIIWLSLNRIEFFSEYKPILMIVSFAVSVLAIRGISSTDLINTILLPYTALGVALSAGIPFVIYFMVVNIGFKEQSPIIRRVAWIFFGIIFIGLWFSREDLGSYQWIYLITAIGAIIMALIDGTMQKFFRKVQAIKLRNLSKQRGLMYLRKELADINENVRLGITTKHDAHNLIRDVEKRIKHFEKRR